MEFSKELLIGLLSGIILSIITAILFQLWKTKLKPFLQKYFSGEISLSGEWISDSKDKFGKYHLQAYIKHYGNKIEGTTQRVQGNKIEMKYQFYGIVRNSIINIIYTERADIKSRFDMGNFLGKIEYGGMRMAGVMSYLSNINNDNIISVPMEFVRVEEGQLFSSDLNKNTEEEMQKEEKQEQGV
jgi:hypothetical protein